MYMRYKTIGTEYYVVGGPADATHPVGERTNDVYSGYYSIQYIREEQKYVLYRSAYHNNRIFWPTRYYKQFMTHQCEHVHI